MNFLALDLSKRSSGWAYFAQGADRAFHGVWDKLASEYTEDRGQTFYKLFEALTHQHQAMPFDVIYAEDLINHLARAVATNAESVRIAAGLAATVELFAYTYRCRLQWINMATWRKHFLGKFNRKSQRIDLKFLALQRCKELGFRPQKDDDAEALGLLDYALSVEGITAPWHALEPLYGAAGAGR